MPNPLPSDLTEAELLALLEGSGDLEGGPEGIPGPPAGVHRKKRSRPFWEAVEAWRGEFEIEPGASPAAPASDLLRHFLDWSRQRPEGVPYFYERDWGRALKRMGLERGREYVNRRDTRPYLMKRNPATYFRQWVQENPPPPVGEAGLQVKTGGRGRFGDS